MFCGVWHIGFSPCLNFSVAQSVALRRFVDDPLVASSRGQGKCRSWAPVVDFIAYLLGLGFAFRRGLTHPLLTPAPEGWRLYFEIARRVPFSLWRLGFDILHGKFSFEIIYLGAEGNDLLLLGTWCLPLPSLLQIVIHVTCAITSPLRNCSAWEWCVRGKLRLNMPGKLGRAGVVNLGLKIRCV